MVYLDADIMVYDNIDHLFDLQTGRFYAVKGCFCEKTWENTPQHKIGYCQQHPAGEAAWPEPPPLYFNAGMFVYEPSLATAGVGDQVVGCVQRRQPRLQLQRRRAARQHQR